MSVTFKVKWSDGGATLRKYADLSSREPEDVCNKKCYYIARRALWGTHKADINKLTDELGATGKFKEISRGPNKGKLRRYGWHFEGPNGAPSMAELILRKRIWAKGGSRSDQPTASEMQKDLKQFISARRKSVAFLKAGWLPCIRTLAPLVKGKSGLPPMDRESKEVGPTKKGGVKPAIKGWISKCIIWNTSETRHSKHKDALITWGEPAAQKAFDDEMQSMKEEVESRLRARALKCGIKTN